VAAVVLLIATAIAASSYKLSSLAPDRSPIALSAKHICTLPAGEPALNSTSDALGQLAAGGEIAAPRGSRVALTVAQL